MNNFRSFIHALSGLQRAVVEEYNLKLHLIALLMVTLLGLYLKVSHVEWILIIIVSSLVIALELLNTAIEALCDTYGTERNERIKYVKDVSAGAVLIVAIGALCTGLIIFIPKL